MTIGQGLIAAALLLVLCSLAYWAWTGCLYHGGKVALERHKFPVLFWVLWALMAGAYSLAFIGWLASMISRSP
jgi:hypothetical protein